MRDFYYANEMSSGNDDGSVYLHDPKEEDEAEEDERKNKYKNWINKGQNLRWRVYYSKSCENDTIIFSRPEPQICIWNASIYIYTIEKRVGRPYAAPDSILKCIRIVSFRIQINS